MSDAWELAVQVWKDKCTDLERQLKEANEGIELEHTWGEGWQKVYNEQFDKNVKLQQQLQAANERIKEYDEINRHLLLERETIAQKLDFISVHGVPKYYEQMESELTQLRQELDQAINNCHYWKEEHDTLRAKLEKMTANCEKIAKHNGEYVKKNNELRVEVERLKAEKDIENRWANKYCARVQELEGALKDIDKLHDGIAKGIEAELTANMALDIAKRALGGKE